MYGTLSQLIDAIQEWPVIVQGALGSALFAFLSYFGQRGTKKIIAVLAKVNENLRKDNLYRELFHKKLMRNSGKAERVMLLSLFQAGSYITNGFIFLSLGWIFEGVIPYSLKIGVFGFLYFVIRAVLWLDRFKVESKETDLQIWNRIKEIEIELHGEAKSDTLEKIKELQLKEK